MKLDFTVKLSELVNQFMGRVQETAIERTSDLKKMMEEVDEMYKRNLETSAQLEKTKELTQQFTLDAWSQFQFEFFDWKCKVYKQMNKLGLTELRAEE